MKRTLQHFNVEQNEEEEKNPRKNLQQRECKLLNEKLTQLDSTHF